MISGKGTRQQSQIIAVFMLVLITLSLPGCSHRSRETAAIVGTGLLTPVIVVGEAVDLEIRQEERERKRAEIQAKWECARGICLQQYCCQQELIPAPGEHEDQERVDRWPADGHYGTRTSYHR